MEPVYGHLMVDVILPGVNRIRYTMPNEDSAAVNGTFADGLWHSVDFEIRQDSVISVVDGRIYTTVQKFMESVSSTQS